MDVLVFGGTAEGRAIVEWLDATNACEIVACTATEYGGELLDGLAHVEARTGPLDDEAKEALVRAHDFACIVDATHPYATHISESLARLAETHGLPLVRLQREAGAEATDVEGAPFTTVATASEAAAVAASRKGNVLLTTGIKDVAIYTEALHDFAERLFVRVLPVPDSILQLKELGVPASHIVAMQGPFSKELNVALIHQLRIDVMVTKESGPTGGFQEKLDAARECNVETIVIERPAQREGGLTFDEARNALRDLLGIRV